MGGWAQGGRISAPIWKQWAQVALKDQPKVPFVAPPGIRWVRIDRATGKPVFGQFPTKEDPQSPVIWEAFQPQTEQQRTDHPTMGDPYNEQRQQQALLAAEQALQQQQQQQQQTPTEGGTTVESRPPPSAAPQPSGLQTTNTF
jgi:penicillin-binding protein 1A